MKTSTTLLSPQVAGLIQRLSCFFVWRRQPLAQQIHAHLALAESRHGTLVARHQKVRVKAVSLRQRLHVETDRTNALQLTLADVESSLTGVRASLDEVSERYDLVARLLAAKPVYATGLAHYRKVLNEDYLAFAGAESSLADEAQAYLMLQSVEAQLELIANEPDIYTKKNIAIAGGFSSGKSAFVNSFIEAPEIKLAVGMRPVTAIPTYVRHASSTAIKAHATAGGTIELEVGLYKKISHDFLKSLGFDLKKIMSFMSIATRMTDVRFENLCLIDTPGFNPPRTGGYTTDDERTASTFATQGDALIWLIGLDSTGTLLASDLEFIHRLDLAGKELYVVANKADLRSTSDIDDILDDIENVLEGEGIAFVGVNAYSSGQAREHAYRRESLQAFFARHNQTVSAGSKLYDTIDRVFDMYRNAIAQDIAESIHSQKTFKSMSLDLQQHASDELINVLSGKFAAFGHAAREMELREHLKAARRVKAQLKAAVHATMCASDVRNLGQPHGAEYFDDSSFEDIDALMAKPAASKAASVEDAARDGARESAVEKDVNNEIPELARTNRADGLLSRILASLSRLAREASEASQGVSDAAAK
ncbi:dynamin family protein [Burkholderia sp. S171]|uniref:dynamin family protein n=1 Tax=Burkholderia sp. S171 TaxID=1641860 RepID=UPI00131D9F0B|nr:dynamin family protein [Burkholderia sp. S171]